MTARAQTIDSLKVKRSQIVDSQGRKVILHGVNVVFKKAPYYPNSSAGVSTNFTAKDAKRLRTWGMNTIRLGVTWKALQPTPGAISSDYAKRIESLASIAGKHGLYVLIDMHQDLYAEQFGGNGAPDWAIKTDNIPFVSLGPFPVNYFAPAVGRALTNFWENRDGIRTQYVSALAQLASRFKNKKYILGYDAFNEPSCDLQTKPCGLPPDPTASARWLKPFYDQLYPAIKKADPSHPVFYEEGVQVNFGWPFHFGSDVSLPRTAKNSGLSFHSYCSELLRKDLSCVEQERRAFTGAERVGTRRSVVPLLTEFGATDDLETIKRLTDIADRFGIGWQYWQYKSYGDPTTQAGSDATAADVESVVDRTGKVKNKKVIALARPFPERIGGSARWSFDPKRRKFRLEIRHANDESVIIVPSVQYPKGFSVKASGATLKKGKGYVVLVPKMNTSRISLDLAPTLSAR